MPKKICIAPGHGGFDPGAIGYGMEEKNINLTIGLALQKLLEAAGVPVVMTRTTDEAAGGATTVQQDLENECAISNNAGADLFFCIHTNSGNGGTGAEIYVYPDGGAQTLADEVVHEVGITMGFHGDPVKESTQLYVLRFTKAPAMLLEIGFIDTAADAEKIKTYLNDFAGWIAPALITWAGGTLPEKAVTTPETATVSGNVSNLDTAKPASPEIPQPPASAKNAMVSVNRSELARILQELIDLVSVKG